MQKILPLLATEGATTGSASGQTTEELNSDGKNPKTC